MSSRSIAIMKTEVLARLVSIQIVNLIGCTKNQKWQTWQSLDLKMKSNLFRTSYQYSIHSAILEETFWLICASPGAAMKSLCGI